MNKLILCLCLYSCVLNSNAQDFTKLINENKVDTFAFYRTPSSISLFLFWTKQNKYYISKEYYENNEKAIKTISIDSLNPMLYYFLNKKEIENSTIKPFTYLKYIPAKNKQDTITLRIAHNLKYEWTINQGNGFQKVELIDFDLWEGSLQNGKNIYSGYNNSQPIAVFFKNAENLLHKLSWTK